MDAALLTPSKYIKAAEFGGKDRLVTITGVKLEELEREDGTKEVRGLVSVLETTKRWVLNVTNVKCLVALFGRETDRWTGKRVVLFPAPNDMSESGVAIRVRGSLDIEKDVSFTLKLARKKPKQITLKAFGKPQRSGAAAAPAPEPVSDDAYGEDDASRGPTPEEEAESARLAEEMVP
jgi:hypothetical protein